MSRVRIDVRRDDGDVTRLEGPAGLAIMMQTSAPSVENIPETPAGAREWMKGVDPAAVSLRASQPEDIVVMLATLVATVNVYGPELVAAAMLLAPYIRADRPDLRRVLP